MKRKIHSEDYGYIAERMNPFFKGSKVVIYIAEEQGIDTVGALQSRVPTHWGENYKPERRIKQC